MKTINLIFQLFTNVPNARYQNHLQQSCNKHIPYRTTPKQLYPYPNCVRCAPAQAAKPSCSNFQRIDSKPLTQPLYAIRYTLLQHQNNRIINIVKNHQPTLHTKVNHTPPIPPTTNPTPQIQQPTSPAPQRQQTTLHHEAGSQHNEPQNKILTPVINNVNTNANTNAYTNGNNLGRPNNIKQEDGPPPDDSDDDNNNGSHSSDDKFQNPEIS
ncbi:hypothetical protein TSUD_154300 [Trifolium subterraneum]|uniref:Uncharacterized protein n=1 Tax=Trifolium subterraneum TaxID=3900 RepID=A0A2Z6P8F8_TRISU|nr:hypothetical protein TSUD_154300 [Trifolium subterraneum]